METLKPNPVHPQQPFAWNARLKFLLLVGISVLTLFPSLESAPAERPWLLLEDGKITFLFTGGYAGQRVWNQPVPVDPPLILQTSVSGARP